MLKQVEIQYRHETVVYRIDSNECLKGRDNSIKFEFADGKLYKAFLETITRKRVCRYDEPILIFFIKKY